MTPSGKTPRGVVFDIGGVLLKFDHMKTCMAMGRRCGKPPEEVYRTIFSNDLEAAYDTGMPTLEFYNEVNERLGADIPFDEFRVMWSDIFEENPGVQEIVQALSRSVHLFILSNTNELHFEFAVERFPFLQNAFDAAFLSYEMGYLKPSPVVYRTVLSRTNMDAWDLFYIDDRDEHVEAALAQGIPSMKFTTIAALKDRLRALGHKV